VKMLADGVYPVWALLPPQAGWQQALDDAGVPFAALPAPSVTTITGKEIVLGPVEALKTVEVAVPSRGTSPVPPADVNWAIAKAASQESNLSDAPPVSGELDPPRSACISPLTAALSAPTDAFPPSLSLLDTVSALFLVASCCLLLRLWCVCCDVSGRRSLGSLEDPAQVRNPTTKVQ
jgi:hypothetical protein